MENNNPKKSKALIITVIILLVFMLLGYLLYTNRDSFGVKTSATISKLFSPFLPSSNTNDAQKIDDGSVNTGGFGSGSNTGLSGIWNSIFNKGGDTNICANDAINSPLCTVGAEGQCLNGNDNPPSCNDEYDGGGTDRKCANDAINYPNCTINKSGVCLNEATNPPSCTLGKDNKCTNGAVDYPNCKVNKDGKCLNGENNPPECNTNSPTPGEGDNTPTLTLVANPQSIIQGESTIISWSGTNVTSCDAGSENGKANSTSKEKSGYFSKKPTQNTTYTVKCIGDNGNIEKTVTVEVKVAETVNKCAILEDNPLLFEPAEKAKLAELLRKYYIISNTLKTEIDINMTYEELDKYKYLIQNVKNLTDKCYAQTAKIDGTKVAGYDGPIIRSGNPWYKETERNSYFGTVTQSKPSCTGTIQMKMMNDKDTNGNNLDKLSCVDANTKYASTCEYVNVFAGDRREGTYTDYARRTSCTWDLGTGLDSDYETALNVW
jgi:hypothetical protein